MSLIAPKVLSFVAPTVGVPVAYRIRIAAANSVPTYSLLPSGLPDPTKYDEVPAAGLTTTAGRVQIPLAGLPKLQGVEGARDVHVTAVEASGNEGDFLEVDNVAFDFSPPSAPTAGRVD